MARVVFTQNIQRHVECPETEAAGGSVREVLDNVFAANPPARSYVLDDQAALRRHMTVFVDGRVEAYPREFLQRSARVSTTADYRALLDDYRIRCAALDSRSRMTAALRGDPDMRLTYADDRWSVFERAQRR